MSVYNVEPDYEVIEVTAGDTIDISFSVALNGVAYDMTGMTLTMAIQYGNGTVLRTLSSGGTSPAITISTGTFNISTTAITVVGTYYYDVQLTNGTAVSTILKGYINVTNQIS